jgi:transposase
MRGERVDILCDEISALPTTIAAPILTAWNAKEDLHDLLALARTSPDGEHTARLLHRFYQQLDALVQLTSGRPWTPAI